MKKPRLNSTIRKIQSLTVEKPQLKAQNGAYRRKKAELERLQKWYQNRVQHPTVRNIKLKNIKSDKVHMMVIDGKITKEAESLLKKFFLPGDYENVEDIVTRTIGNKSSASVEQIAARISQNRISIFLANQGLSAQQVAEAINEQRGYQITAEYVLDRNNWERDVFILPDGVMVKFTFRYYEPVYIPEFI